MTLNEMLRAIAGFFGGFVDDVVAYRFSPEHIFICVNASNREKDFAWMSKQAIKVKPVDRSEEYAQIAIQGPKAFGVVQRLAARPLDAVGTYRFTTGAVAGVECIIARTGYTGEDGFELYCAPADAERLWFALLDEGKGEGLIPAGLGARDSLRTEMKYALYGNDIDDAHTPLGGSSSWTSPTSSARRRWWPRRPPEYRASSSASSSSSRAFLAPTTPSGRTARRWAR